MLHVPLAELAAGAAQQMLAGRPRRGVDQGRRVLELIAEAVRAARLVVSAAPPVPGGERLILEPAVDEDVQRGVRRLGIDHAQRALPELPHLLQRLARAGRPAEPSHQGVRLVGGPAGTQHEDHFAFLAVRDIELRLHRRARVEARSGPARQSRPAQRGGIGQCAVAAEKLRAAAGDGPRGLAGIDEHGAIGELAVVDVAGEQRAGVRVGLRHDVHQVRVPPLAEHQLPVTRDREPSRPARVVAELDHRKLYRRVQRDVDPHFRAYVELGVLENAVAEAVARRCRCRRRGPATESATRTARSAHRGYRTPRPWHRSPDHRATW